MTTILVSVPEVKGEVILDIRHWETVAMIKQKVCYRLNQPIEEQKREKGYTRKTPLDPDDFTLYRKSQEDYVMERRKD